MNTSININRIGLLLKRFFTENIQREITFWGIVTLIFMLIHNPDSVSMFLYISGFIFAARQFNIFAYAPSGMHYLLIPATHIEKLISSILISIVYYFVMVVICYIIGTYVGTTVGNILFDRNATIEFGLLQMNNFQEGIPSVFQVFIENNLLKTFTTFATIQSIFLLGSIYFKRNAVGKTMLSLFVLGVIFFIIELILLKTITGRTSFHFNDMMLSNYDFESSTTMNLLTKIEELKSFILIPFLWVVSYFRLTEKEV